MTSLAACIGRLFMALFLALVLVSQTHSTPVFAQGTPAQGVQRPGPSPINETLRRQLTGIEYFGDSRAVSEYVLATNQIAGACFNGAILQPNVINRHMSRASRVIRAAQRGDVNAAERALYASMKILWKVRYLCSPVQPQ